eukprot:11921199-Alexandrium_andersonii.AAC.1
MIWSGLPHETPWASSTQPHSSRACTGHPLHCGARPAARARFRTRTTVSSLTALVTAPVSSNASIGSPAQSTLSLIHI